ncbi:MAG: response regulator [Candidatus Melainabacteria bacterium]|nr:response regulator [Candidatus Melainabacteria bacterium]
MRDFKKEINILLVEDNQDDVLLTQLAAGECNINGNFLVVNNGKTALQLLDSLVDEMKKLPDLIMLDINLPKVTGIEVLKYIKSCEYTSSIPTIIFTSSDSMSDMKYCYELGADLFIRKPNSIGDFKEIMQYIKNYCFV